MIQNVFKTSIYLDRKIKYTIEVFLEKISLTEKKKVRLNDYLVLGARILNTILKEAAIPDDLGYLLLKHDQEALSELRKYIEAIRRAEGYFEGELNE